MNLQFDFNAKFCVQSNFFQVTDSELIFQTSPQTRYHAKILVGGIRTVDCKLKNSIKKS